MRVNDINWKGLVLGLSENGTSTGCSTNKEYFDERYPLDATIYLLL